MYDHLVLVKIILKRIKDGKIFIAICITPIQIKIILYQLLRPQEKLKQDHKVYSCVFIPFDETKTKVCIKKLVLYY